VQGEEKTRRLGKDNDFHERRRLKGGLIATRGELFALDVYHQATRKNSIRKVKARKKLKGTGRALKKGGTSLSPEPEKNGESTEPAAKNLTCEEQKKNRENAGGKRLSLISAADKSLV